MEKPVAQNLAVLIVLVSLVVQIQVPRGGVVVQGDPVLHDELAITPRFGAREVVVVCRRDGGPHVVLSSYMEKAFLLLLLSFVEKFFFVENKISWIPSNMRALRARGVPICA